MAFIFSAASFFLASLCKEPALTLPVILVVYDYLRKDEKVLQTPALKRYSIFFGIAAIYFFLRLQALGGLAPAKKFTAIGTYRLLINIVPLFFRYLQKLIFPLNLNASYLFHPASSILETMVLVPLLVVVLFFLVLILLRKSRITVLSSMLMIVPLLPVLYIPGLGEGAFAERYLYLPSFGFVMLAALLFTKIKAAVPKSFVILICILLAVTACYASELVNRNTVWKDSYSLWMDAVSKSPENAVAHASLGYALYSKGRIDEAIQEYRTALGLRPDLIETRMNLAIAYTAHGRSDEAILEYIAALKKMPDSAEGHNGLGSAFAAKGLTDQAIEEYNRALELNPNLAEAYNNMGIIYGNKGIIDLAIKNFAYAAQLNPGNVMYRDNLARAYRMKPGPNM